MKDSHTTVVTK